MRVLVFGRAGQVASELCRAEWPKEFVVSVAGRDRVDIANWRDVARVFAEERPELVVNAAAYTAVDTAESNESEAYAVNSMGPANLAYACASDCIPLIHISTDYVYDGTKSRPYLETDTPRPASVYGRSKLVGDLQVIRALEHYVILRVSWVYSAVGHNFVRTMLRLGSERDHLRVVGDQHGCPTAAGDLARTIVQVCREISAGREPWGLYHFAARGTTTWYDFAEEIFRAASDILPELKSPRLERIATAEFPTAATRPANSVLDCGKFDQTFEIPRRPWREALREVVQELLRQ